MSRSSCSSVLVAFAFVLVFAACHDDHMVGADDPDAPAIDAPAIDAPAIDVAAGTQACVWSVASATVNEGASVAATVRLVAPPAGPLTATMVSHDPTAAATAPVSVTFSPADFATPRTVTIIGVADADIVDEVVTIACAVPGGELGLLAVSVVDTDVITIETSVASMVINEGGSGTFGVRLSGQPAADVVVTVTSNDAGAVAVAPTALVFTPANWNVLQILTLTGVQDADTNDEPALVALSAAGLPTRTVAVTVVDDDAAVTQACLWSVTSVTVNEGGSVAATVRLAAQPAGPITATIASSDPAAAAAPASVTFSPANFATPQTVIITGVPDADTVSEAVTILCAVPAGNTGALAVTVVDTDVIMIETSVAALSINEGGNGTFGVRLSAQPAANVVVSVSSNDVSAVVVTPTAFVFTPANWNVLQTVTLSGVQDADINDENALVVLSATGLPPRTVTVTVVDDD